VNPTPHPIFNIAVATSTQQQTSNPKACRQQQRQQQHPSHLHFFAFSSPTFQVWRRIQELCEILTYTSGAGDLWMGRFGFLLPLFLRCGLVQTGVIIFTFAFAKEEQVGSNHERTASVA